MIPPGECMYAGRKRRKPVQKQKPAAGAERSNPSKRHRDRLNAELDHLANLLPLPPDVVSKLDKLSVLRLSVSYLRVKSFFQAVQEQCPRQPAGSAPSPGDSGARGGSAVLEGRLLLESLDGFALVVSAEGVIFYASATITDYLGFHQTDVMHQNIYDYIHVDDRQDFCRQLHWAMDPPQVACGQPLRSEPGEDAILGRLLRAQDGRAGPSEFSAFLTRCFVCRVRCLLDSTSGFLTMQFQGKLKFLFGQKRKALSGTALSPRLSLFCIVVPVLLPSVAEMKMKGAFLRMKHRSDTAAPTDTKARQDHEWVPSSSSGVRARREIHAYDCCFQTPRPMRHLNWVTGEHGQDGAKRKLEPSRRDPPSVPAVPRGSCVPYPGAAGTVPASSLSAFRNSPSCHQPPGAYSSRAGRTLRDGVQSQAHPPANCPFPQGSLESRLPQAGVQRLAARAYSTEDIKLRGVPVPPGTLCNPVLSLDVPIKMESDCGSEDAADGYSMSPNPVWLGASDMAKRQLVTFQTRMHLKTEPDSRHYLYAPHLGHGMPRAPSRPSRELTPVHPTPCICLEPPPCLCVQGHQPPALGCDCRDPGTPPMIKREPLDCPSWAPHSQSGAPGVLPKSALATLLPSTASECTFLP